MKKPLDIDAAEKRLAFIFEYSFDNAADYIERIKPITDALIAEVRELRKGDGQ